jgi:hypothetical protein
MVGVNEVGMGMVYFLGSRLTLEGRALSCPSMRCAYSGLHSMRQVVACHE